MMDLRLCRLLVVLGSVLVLQPGLAQAPAPRQKAVTLVVPFAAGGGTDTLARLVGAKLHATLGHAVIVENRPGANGAIASKSVLAQPADGQTLLFGSYSTQVIAPLAARQNAEAMGATLSGFTALAIIGYAPLALAVHGNSPHRTFGQFISAARSKQTTFGSFGAGSSAHLLGEILAANTQAQLLHVPYKGSAPASTDLVGGHLDSVILTVAALQPLVTNGTLRALAVSSSSRMPAMPNVPTFAEAGQSGLADTGWFAVFAPSSLPADLAGKLRSTLRQIAAEPEFRNKLIELGMEPTGSEAGDAQAMWRKSIDAARLVLKETKIELD